MFKPITLTGSVVSLALLSACAPSPAPLSLSERLPIAVDLVRQPNGDSRPRSDVIRAEAACELSAAAVRGKRHDVYHSQFTRTVDGARRIVEHDRSG